MVELAQCPWHWSSAGEAYVGAEVYVSMHTPLAPVAGLSRIHSNKGAGRHAELLSTLVVHDGRELVPKHEGRLGNRSPNLTLFVIMEVRAAHRHSLYPQA
jgi:hypothetical protein